MSEHSPEPDTSAPDADVMQRVAEALEATDPGGGTTTITLATDKAPEPLLPRRGS